MIQNPQEVINQIKSKQYFPVYFLQGDEPYYIDQIVSFMEKNVLSEVEKAFNCSIFYGKDSSIVDILSRAKAYPMGAEYQVILVKEAQDLADFTKSTNLKLIESYLDHPQGSTILVFAYKNETLDKRTVLGKLIADKTVLVSCSKIYENKIPVWIQEYVQVNGFKIDTKAALLLQQYIGSNLTLLGSEIDKICINIAGGVSITDDHVKEYVGISKKYNVFELQNAIAEKNFHFAQKIVQNLMFDSKSNSIVVIIGMMFSFFSKLLVVHQFSKKSPNELASVLQVHPFFVDQYLQAAKNYNVQKTIKNIEFIHCADLQAKGVDYPAVSEVDLLKMLIFNIFQ